jgi:hypothetical protein
MGHNQQRPATGTTFRNDLEVLSPLQCGEYFDARLRTALLSLKKFFSKDMTNKIY